VSVTLYKKIKILHLEDSIKDFELLHSIIESEKIEHDYFLTDNEKDFINILETENVDIILSDYSLPDYDGSEALKVAREKYPSIPFIFVSGKIGEDAAINAMLNGATDYVLKNKLERLIPAIKRALHEHDLEIKTNKAEEELRENRKLLYDAQKLTHVGVWNWKADIDCVTWTEELYKIAGLDPKSPAPTYAQHSTIYTPQSWHLLNNAVEEAMKSSEPYELELELIRSDGSIRNIIAFGGAKIDDKKQIIGLYGTVQDITDRKQVELELIKAKEKAEESDRLKSAFLTNMSHEIRTPMNGILGFTELLKEPNLSSDDQQDFIQIIQISGARMLDTINSIVDISKIESGLVNVDIKETNINEKIEFIYKFFKPEVEIKGLQFLFKNSLPTKESIIKTDNEKVYGILTNLVKNAIKFTFEGSIELGYEKKGEYLEFFVKDTGVGIPQKQHQMIFVRFRQGDESLNRGYEGSGLGLSICKSYVEMLGGRIWVESEEGRGSTFYFTIPYNAVSEEKIELLNAVSAKLKDVEIKKLKVLIVEDDEISYSLLTRMLQKISYVVLHAITGIEAVEACRNNPDLDLVLMDIRMPNMDGNEETRQIRQFNKDVVIIAQTAYAFTGDREKAIEAGCNDYISKPIDKTILYELIKKHVNKSKINTNKIYQL